MNRDAFYAWVYDWCCARAAERRAVDGPCVIGINGPQGAGKTTLARWLVTACEAAGRRAVSVSIDDFYKTRAEQLALAAAHPDNPYLQQRGYPGTHDVALGVAILRALRTARAGEAVTLPVYDKSAHGGKGDRGPPAGKRVEGPFDLVFLEGWMLGFAPVGEAACGADAALAAVDALLAPYEGWVAELDALIQLRMADDRYVLHWRVEAEQAMRASGKAGMSDEEARRYVAQFLPAYAVWPAALAAGLRPGLPHLAITLGSDRLPMTTPQ